MCSTRSMCLTWESLHCFCNSHHFKNSSVHKQHYGTIKAIGICNCGSWITKGSFNTEFVWIVQQSRKVSKCQAGLLHLMEAAEKVFHLEAFTSFSGTIATTVGFLSVNGHMQDMKYQGQAPSATVLQTGTVT